jgi:2-(1,2-epoxy-1,2-dihydrophenyl)acetyl-CoA isomerase
MKYSDLQIHFAEGIAQVILNRPDRLNALNAHMAEELANAVSEFGKDENTRVIILRGAGRAFCAGGDVKEMYEIVKQNPQNPDRFFVGPLASINLAANAIVQCPKPVIALIHGFASGAGFNLALACDFRFAADSAKFNQAFVNIGLVPDTGGTWSLPRLIGLAKAAEFMMTGNFITAADAERLGMINQSVPESALDRTVLSFAEKLVNRPTRALAAIKKLLQGSYRNSFSAQAEEERLVQIELARSEDFKEGLTAFVTKREPHFKGR